MPAARGNKNQRGGKEECGTGPLSAACGPTSRRVTQNERFKRVQLGCFIRKSNWSIYIHEGIGNEAEMRQDKQRNIAKWAKTKASESK